MQNYPVIHVSAATDATHRSVKATLDTAPNQALRVDFYQAFACNGARGADATNYVGGVNINSGATGAVQISATIAEAGKSGYLTATATTTGTGQTS